MIKRYFATQDNTITNAFGESLTTRGVSGSMGLSDILEVFSIYGQVSSSATGFSLEEARVLVEFDLTQIEADIANKTIPSNAKYFLRLFNAEHGETIPREYNLNVNSINGAWQEGLGLDMEGYTDLSSGFGSNWIVRSGSTAWTAEGGDIYASPTATQFLDTGLEDLNVDVTSQVALWLDDTKVNNGFLVKLPTSLADGTQQRSYYTKRFFARGTQFFHKRPCLEVRWNSQLLDDRVNFYSSSSLAPAVDNLNTLYLYNYHRGQLADIPAVAQGAIYVDLYASLGSTALTQCVDTPATGGWVETGIYTASVCLNTTSSTLNDVWYKGTIQYHTGSINVKQSSAITAAPDNNLVVTVSNNRSFHYKDQTSRFYLYIRQKNWSPNIYTTATTVPQTEVFESLYYKIIKVATDETIFDYDTTNNSTLLSYDSRGNYFDLDIGMLEPNYTYQIELSLYNVATKSYEQLSFQHKFRVVNNEY